MSHDRDLNKYPITFNEVIDFVQMNVELEDVVTEASGLGRIDTKIARTALAVVKAAAVIVQNDLGSTAGQTLRAAFRSQCTTPAEPNMELAD